MSIVDLLDRFNTDAACRDLLAGLRWPDGAACLRCGRHGSLQNHGTPPVVEMPQLRVSVQRHDGHHYARHPSCRCGSGSRRSTLLCEAKKGMSAMQLKRTLKIAYKTAWYLCHRIREAMGNDALSGPTLLGVVEVDETLVGGKVRGKGRKAGRANKFYVAGAIQRGGQVRLKHVPNIRKTTLHRFIAETVKGRGRGYLYRRTEVLPRHRGCGHAA